MSHPVETFKLIAQGLQVGADFVTLVLGGIALWGLVFHKKKISLIIKVLVNSFLNERVKRIKETLGKLDSLDYNDKEDRGEIFALLGQVSGQIKPLTATDQHLLSLYAEIQTILEKKSPLNEATKRRLVYALHGQLDGASFAETQKILD